MGHIKATFFPSAASITNTSCQASRIIADTRRDLLQCIQEKRAKWSIRLKERSTRGFKRGFEAGLEAARIELTKKCYELSEAFEKNIRSAERECVRIALEVCESTIKESFDSSRDLISARVNDLLDKFIKSQETLVRVNAYDASKLTSQISRKDVKIIISEQIERGDFEIETSSGSVFISWKDALNGLREDLSQKLDALRHISLNGCLE